MISRIAALLDRRPWLLLSIVVAGAHLLGFWSCGATFWVDSTVYAGLGDCLFSPEKMRVFYDATGRFVFSHLAPGEPAVWACARLLPVGARWPAMAIAQHAFAAGAAIFAFGSLQRWLPGVWNLACAALLSFLPFYQSLHNALLTESISSSLFLIGLTLLLRMAHERGPAGRDWVAFLAVMFAGTQFRGYIGVLLAASAAVVLLWRMERFRWMPWLAVVAVCAASMAVFPIYRWALTGRLFGPGLRTNRLVVAAWTNPNPSPALLEALPALGWSGDPAAIFSRDFTYWKARDAGVAWEAEGLSSSEIDRRVAAMSRAIEFEWPSSILMHARSGLAASGMVTLAFAGAGGEPAYGRFTLAGQRVHQRWWYSWLSWIEHDSYRSFGEKFFTAPSTMFAGADQAQRDFWSACEPHLGEKHRQMRDPLLLGRLPLDFWALLGWTAIAVCLWRRPVLGLILAAPIAGNFVVMTATPIGNARYAYPILACYFVAMSVAGGLLFRQPKPSANTISD